MKSNNSNLNVLPSAVLLVAAVLKGWQLAFEPNLDIEKLKLFSICVINFEFFLGVFLATGMRKPQLRVIGIVTFGIFCSAASYKMIAGDHSCGCFGAAAISPIQSLVLDLICIYALCLWDISNSRRLSMRLLSIVSVVAIIGTSLFVVNQPSNLSSVGQIIGNGKTVLVDTQDWAGRSFPLFDHMRGESSFLRKGDWQVLLYSNSCEECQQVISEIKRNQASVPPTVCINLTGESRHADSQNIRWRSLNSDFDWIGAVPIWLAIRDGVVRN